MLISLRQQQFSMSTMTCDSNTDVCIAIDDIFNGLSSVLKTFRIICTKTQQSAKVIRALKLAGKEVVKIKPEDVFTCSYLDQTECRIVKWLNTNKQVFSNMNQFSDFKSPKSAETFP